MLTAYHQIKERKVMAAEAEKAKGVFFCPACGSELRLKRGLKRIAHFAHIQDKNCRYQGESQLHLRIKKQIYMSLQEEIGSRVKSIELEKLVGDIRPDVYVEGFKKNIGIEVQISTMTPAELIRRTKAYYQAKIPVLWVLPFDAQRIFTHNDQGEQIFKAFRLREYERMLMRMYFKHLFFWDDTEKVSKGFIALKMGDAYGSASSFYSVDWSTVIELNPKKLKSKKRPLAIQYNLGLGDFKPQYAAKFKMPGAAYYLPDRFIINLSPK